MLVNFKVFEINDIKLKERPIEDVLAALHTSGIGKFLHLYYSKFGQKYTHYLFCILDISPQTFSKFSPQKMSWC